jgi:hypothetical protein
VPVTSERRRETADRRSGKTLQLDATHDVTRRTLGPRQEARGFRQIVGGLGSGRRFPRARKQQVEECFVLDVAFLAGRPRVPGEEGTITLPSAALNGEWPALYIVRRVDGFVLTLWRAVRDGTVRQDFRLVTSALASGGERVYFLCPGWPDRQPCASRVAKLYAPWFGAQPFLCRSCHHLAYRSSQTRKDPVWFERLKAEARATGWL